MLTKEDTPAHAEAQQFIGTAPQFLLAPGSYYTLKDDPSGVYDTIDLPALEKLLAEPTARSKHDAAFFIPSAYVAHDGRNHAAQRRHGAFWALTLDVDSGDIAQDALEAALEAVLGPVLVYVYSSSSATPSARKWRAIVPLARPLTGDKFSAYQNAFYDLLQDHGIAADRTLARAAQAVFLPNVPPDKRDENGDPIFYEYTILDGHRLDPSAGDLHELAETLLEC